MDVTHSENPDGSLDITISLNADDVLCLKHDLEGIAGIVAWYTAGPSAEKVFKCGERMDKQWRDIMDNDPAVENVPADRGSRLKLIQARPDYQDREQREVEIRAKMAAEEAARTG